MKKFLFVFLLIPNFAFAAENGPIELMIGIGGMLLIVVFGLIYTSQADKASDDPNNTNFANIDNLYAKLINQLDWQGAYDVDVVRQSGNIERTISGLDANEVIAQISATMKRAKIDVVSVRGSSNQMSLYRTIHNGRGRQEGKRIGGFEVRKVGEFNVSIVPEQELMDKYSDIENFDDLNNRVDEILDDLKQRREHAKFTSIRVNPQNEAQKAILKAFFKIYDQFDDYPLVFEAEFDPETGEGDASINYYGVIQMLVIAGGYLGAANDITDELREQLLVSDAEWQQKLGKDEDADLIYGIMSFGSASPKDIQTEVSAMWAECSNLVNTDKHDYSDEDYEFRQICKALMRDARPDILDMKL